MIQESVRPNGPARWTVVLVTHNSEDDLRQYWVGNTFLDPVQVIVVDNGSSDQSIELARKFANIVLSQGNVGLSRANNLGLSRAVNELVAFCNPDVSVTSDTLSRLGRVLTERGGIVAPRLVGTDGLPQPNGRAWPTLPRLLMRKVRPQGKTAHRYLWPEDVRWVTGAFMASRRQDWIALGGWPEDYFLYFEDVELCVRAHRFGVPVTLDESSVAVHGWARASSSSLLSLGARQHAKSLVRFYSETPQLIFGGFR